MAAAPLLDRRKGTLAVAFSLLAVGVGIASLSSLDALVKPETAVFAVCAITAELLIARYSEQIRVSGGFIAGLMAVGFLGPSAAFAIPALALLAAWALDRYRWQALVLNVAGAAVPTCVVAVVFDAIDPPRHGAVFIAVLGAAAAVTMTLNFVLVGPLFAMLDGGRILDALRALRGLVPALVINVAVIAVSAEVYAEYGFAALALVLVNVVAFSYMARLVATARDRTREYANLSWGVLSGLIRTLDERDSRAARHCAAVAAFSRDIAKRSRMSKRDQELAHTAGLLHDIGKFVLSDRVMERGGELADADWRGVRRHPDIGAELLRDIGVYGPVAEIVRAHHERVDGRGYPRGLRGDEIPPIARIVAVAEVYDTLTAPDTYRTPMTSFEALNELRRVAGMQLDAAYVEALAAVLAGRGTDYRHADEADFDRELDIERRMNEAVAPTT
jgi:putative nucleotidyltransferase with HDIG domain